MHVNRKKRPMNATPPAAHRNTRFTAAAAHATAPSDNSAPSDVLDVLVIGAGQAGLAMAWHLARRGVRYLLIDAPPRSGTPGEPAGTR